MIPVARSGGPPQQQRGSCQGLRVWNGRPLGRSASDAESRSAAPRPTNPAFFGMKRGQRETGREEGGRGREREGGREGGRWVGWVGWAGRWGYEAWETWRNHTTSDAHGTSQCPGSPPREACRSCAPS